MEITKMRIEQAKKANGEPKTYKNTKHFTPAKDGKEASGFEVEVNPSYKQFDTLQEAISDAGSEENLLKYVNSAFRSDAIRAGTMYDGGATATPEGVKSKILDTIENMTIATLLTSGRGGRTSAKETLESAKAAAAAGDMDALLKILGVSVG